MGGTIWNPDAGSVPPYRTVKKSPMAIRKNKPDAATEIIPHAECAAAVCIQLLAAHDQGAEAGTPLLTEAGIDELRRLVRANGGHRAMARATTAVGPRVPDWNGGLGELWLGGEFLCEINPASYPAMILAAFQSHGWAAGHIPNPLPSEPGESADDVRGRLENAVKNLNRKLPAGTLRFRPTHSGAGVRWEYAPAKSR